MSTTASAVAADSPSKLRVHPWLRGLAVLAPAVAGLWCLRSPLAGVYQLLASDPTRSIGLLIPPVAAILAWRCWREEDWSRGQWWGLALIAVAIAAAQAQAGFGPMLVLSNARGVVPFGLIPAAALICLYVSGIVVLFGGRRAWAKAAFPLLLLLFLNPLPGWFTDLVDLPLQAVAARSARAFAALLQVPVSGGTLKMMFNPALGMFIAPGCDGLRGTVTMGLLAAVTGHLYRLPGWRFALYVTGAILSAYLLNLVRLCGVVIYYWCALRLPAIGAYGTQIDYLIGGTLFVGAAFVVLGLPRRWQKAAPSHSVQTGSGDAAGAGEHAVSVCGSFGGFSEPHGFYRYGALLAVLVLGVALSLVTVDSGRAASPEARAVVLLPQGLGARHIRERWNNPQPRRALEEGALYAGAATLPEVQLDFYRNSPVRHNGAICYVSQGESVLWERPQVLPLKAGTAQFDVLLLRGMNQLRIVAATECAAAGCAETDLHEMSEGTRLRLAVRDARTAGESFVPVSVVMTRTVVGTDDEEAVGAAMEQDLRAALRELDLSPARRLAGLQSGH